MGILDHLVHLLTRSIQSMFTDLGVSTKKFAVVTLCSYFPALFDHTMRIACELVRNVNARVAIDLNIQTKGCYNEPNERTVTNYPTGSYYL